MGNTKIPPRTCSKNMHVHTISVDLRSITPTELLKHIYSRSKLCYVLCKQVAYVKVSTSSHIQFIL